MDDDDEFGDLYTDVLRPLSAQFQPHPEESGAAAAVGKALAFSQGGPIDLNFNIDDEEILYGTPDKKNQNQNSNPKPIPDLKSNTVPGQNLNASAQEKNLAQPRGFDLNLSSNSEAEMVDGFVGKGDDGWRLGAQVLEKGEEVKIPLKASEKSHFLGDDDDDINIVLEDGEDKDGDSFEKEDAAVQEENILSSSNMRLVGEEIGLEVRVPGLSGRLENENQRCSDFEDEWESEDDLQIVLNDNNNVPMAMEGMVGVNDEDGEPLVIVADNVDVGHHQVVKGEAVWGGDEGPKVDVDKDVGDAARISVGNGSVASAAIPPKTAYSNHLYHHQFHSQFKYVRPGAVPLPAAAPGGMPAQVRPPICVGPLSGSGRGAPGMQKVFHPGYGSPALGPNTAGRGYGSGLDFTLPSHKSIFEVDIDSFEDKPWKIPGIDVSIFFNFGLNENSWRDYCKQLELLRLGKTMGRKICVYESGRTEQDYDPEHAAAVGIQEIPSESADPGMADAGLTDLECGSANGQPSHPVGRPIPVDTSFVERHPSADIRRPRFHDADTIIEIVCHSPMGQDMLEQDDGSAGKDLGGGGETDYFKEDDKDDTDRFSLSHNGNKREAESRRAQLKNTISGDEIVRENLQEERSAKGMEHGRLLMKTAGDNRADHLTDDRDEESIHSGDGKHRSPNSSSSCTIESQGDQALVVENSMNKGSVVDCRRIDTEREEIDVVLTAGYTREDGSLKYSIKKQNLSSTVEQSFEQDDDDDDNAEDSEDAKSNEIRKSRSGSGIDHRRLPEDVDDEVHQDRHCPPVIKKQVGEDDNARRKIRYERDESGSHIMVARAKESFFRKRGDANSSLHCHGKFESANWRKESDISDGSWHIRDDDHGSRVRVEDLRKREHGSRNRGKFRESEKSEKDEHPQSRNYLDNGGSRGANHDNNGFGSRQRDRDIYPKNRNEKVDDLHSKRKKDESQKSQEHPEKGDISRNNRGSSSRRKRDNDDGSDQLKRDDDVHTVRQKEGGSFQRQRSERPREREEWYRIKKDEVSSRREREEARPMMRNERVIEDKSRISHSRGKESYKESSREYNPNVVARHGDQFKRRDRIENGCFSQLRGHKDTYGNQLVNDDKKTRYERPGNRDVCVAYEFDASRMIEHKRNEAGRKNKEPESGDRGSLIPNQRTHGGQISETVNSRDRSERQSVEVHLKVCQSSRRMPNEDYDEETASEGQHSPDLRKGRSKSERWTSHKEDFIPTSTSMPSDSRDREIDTLESIGGASFVISTPPEENLSNKVGDEQQLLAGEKDSGAETNSANPKVSMEDNNKQLDTVEKLKKRSERFKLPMPSEKDITRTESELLPLGQQTDTQSDSWIKSERPARKRRWIGK